MLKTSFVMLAFLFAGVAGHDALAQQQKKSAPGKSETITFEMLVEQYKFPVKKNSGNPDKDYQEYAAAKNKWIAANQELYQRYNQQEAQLNQQGVQTDASLKSRRQEANSTRKSTFSPAN
jgi:hypothetical protein